MCESVQLGRADTWPPARGRTQAMQVLAHSPLEVDLLGEAHEVFREGQSCVQHDFLSDPVSFEMSAESGWLRAADTTLGADNGIGAAAGP